jgi:hypothetical protein
VSCDYTLRLWDRLTVFLKHPVIEIDNNWCENAIRPLALERKNWLHLGSPQAGQSAAAIVSVSETCHRLAINPRDYLLAVLPQDRREYRPPCRRPHPRGLATPATRAQLSPARKKIAPAGDWV